MRILLALLLLTACTDRTSMEMHPSGLPRCIDGYLTDVGRSGLTKQILDEDGKAQPCPLT